MKKLDIELNKSSKEENDSDKIKDDPIGLAKKSNRYTGKRGRLFKKCKEINKCYNLNSLTNYNSYYFDNQSNDNNSDNITFSINELTEDKI